MDIGKSIQLSFDLYLKNFLTLFLACLIAGILSMVTLGILAGPLVAGLLVLCLKLLRGENGEWKEIFNHFDQFLPTFLVTLVLWGASLAIWIIASFPFIGWLIQIIVGPVLGLLYFLTIGFVVDKKMKPLEALQRSINFFAAEPLLLWMYGLLFGILGGIGVILFGIGVFLTIPFGVAGFAIAYQGLSSKVAFPYKPEKQKLQIAGIILAVLLIGGLLNMTIGFGRTSPSIPGTGITSRIISGITGQKVRIDQTGKSISIGNLSMGTGLPIDFPKDIPVYPKAEIGAYLSGKDGDITGSTTTFTSKDPVNVVFEFYVGRLKDGGWEIETNELGEMKIISLSKNNRKAGITITSSASLTNILIGITNE
jgi:hypothetical protein